MAVIDIKRAIGRQRRGRRKHARTTSAKSVWHEGRCSKMGGIWFIWDLKLWLGDKKYELKIDVLGPDTHQEEEEVRVLNRIIR